MRLLPLLLLLLLPGCATPTEKAASLREEARWLYDTGRRDEAIATLERALAADPDDVESEMLLGSVLHGSGRPEEAVAHFRRASELSPDAYAPNYGLGALLSRLGRYDEAEPPLRRALELRPGDVPSLVHLAENAYRTERYAECLTRYDAVLDALVGQPTLADRDRMLVAASVERRQLCLDQESPEA